MPYNLAIPGQINERELWAIEALAKLVPPGGVVVEVGSFLGLSSYTWAKSVDPSVTVYCIDPWQGYKSAAEVFKKRYGVNYNLETFNNFIETCPNIIPIQGLSPQDFVNWEQLIDIYFDDADHQNPGFNDNIALWSKFVKPGGIICGHAYSEKFPDVLAEVSKLGQVYNVKPVIAGSIWCLPTDGNVTRLRNVAEINGIHGYQYQWQFNEYPKLVNPGDLLQISGRLKNCSGRDWQIFVDDTEVIKIGVKVYEGDREEKKSEPRESLRVDKLTGGATVEFDFVLDTREVNQGKIRLEFDLVAEGWYWFKSKGAKPETLEVSVLPRTAGNLIKAGNQLKREGKLSAAIAEYRWAIELNPNFAWSHYNLADALAKQGHLEEAVAEYRKAIKLNPNSALCYDKLGRALDELNQFDLAVNCYRKALNIQPEIYDKFKTIEPVLFKENGEKDWKPLVDPKLDRYSQVTQCINLFKPSSIIEVGTWRGNRAIEMVKTALNHREKVHYIGFDLFEDANEQSDKDELNVKEHYTVAQVASRLKEIQTNFSGFTFELIKGNTKRTLQAPRKADFAFIDGGHSLETIYSDYKALQECSVVLFDDYYLPDAKDRCPNIEKFGCNKIVKSLPYYLLPILGPIKEGGLVAMALVLKDKQNLTKAKSENAQNFFLGLNTASITQSNGDLGLFYGNKEDLEVFGTYSKFGIWSPEVQYLLIEKLFSEAREGTYLDIGANIGLTTIPLAKEYPDVRCFAFEPDPENYHLLLKNIIIQQVASSVNSYPIALFSHSTQVDFELSSHNNGDHIIRLKSTSYLAPALQGETSRKVIKVPAERLDNILNSQNINFLKKPIVMKVDIQGSELQFCYGASVFLKSVDYLITEFWPYGLRRLGDTPEALMTLLAKQFSFGAILKSYNLRNFLPETKKQQIVTIQKDIDSLSLKPVEQVFTELKNRLRLNDVNFTGHLNVFLSKHPNFSQIPRR